MAVEGVGVASPRRAASACGLSCEGSGWRGRPLVPGRLVLILVPTPTLVPTLPPPVVLGRFDGLLLLLVLPPERLWDEEEEDEGRRMLVPGEREEEGGGYDRGSVVRESVCHAKCVECM